MIRVGTGTLAWAFDYNADNNPWNDEKNSYVQSWKVTDPKQFAEDVRIAALDESEDGSSPLTRFLDQICQSAVEAGSLGISESGEVSEG